MHPTTDSDVNTMHGTKRPIDDGSGNETKVQKTEVETVQKAETETIQRIKRKNHAMLLGYVGKDYYGMQRNPGIKTIEEELITALLKADLITAVQFENVRTINFQRAARTDKGVSAIRQIVSLKLRKINILNINVIYISFLRIRYCLKAIWIYIVAFICLY